jgi:hypothetical protein
VNWSKPATPMRLKIGTFTGLALITLLLSGCDHCGDPVQFNLPGAPKSCYEQPQK